MKAVPWIAMLVLSASCVAPTIAAPDLGLPELHKINRVTLSPNFGCRSEQDINKGYENTALFLSLYSRRMNSPELLFNGACKSSDWFEAATAGDDLDVMADYGEWPIEDLTAQQVFSPRRLAGAYAQFAQSVSVREGHTYGLLINKPEIRGFFFFQECAIFLIRRRS
jgi:hypothetical protein